MAFGYSSLYVGRPLEGFDDEFPRSIAERIGIERHHVHGGESRRAFIGLHVRSLGGPYECLKVTAGLFAVPDDTMEEARAICDALPDHVKAMPQLGEFGVYLITVTSD